MRGEKDAGGRETSFQSLKYTVGLLHFHAKKAENILKEVFARLTLYIFADNLSLEMCLRLFFFTTDLLPDGFDVRVFQYMIRKIHTDARRFRCSEITIHRLDDRCDQLGILIQQRFLVVFVNDKVRDGSFRIKTQKINAKAILHKKSPCIYW